MGIRIRTSITGTIGGPWVSTMNFVGSNLTDATNAANAVRAFWLSVSSEMQCGGLLVVESDVEVYNDSTGEAEALLSVPGLVPITLTLASTQLPVVTQALIRWRTGVYDGGREIRGRTFIPGLSESRNTSGQLDAALITNLTNWASALISDSGSILGVYSKKAGSTAVVVSGSPWSQWAELRSRRDR